MPTILFACNGGTITLPDPQGVLVDRHDGGNLIVSPPRDVWERSELTREELTVWSFLVAAAGKAMLDVLPQLAGGCINYWEAGNWSLNDASPPRGPKTATQHRHVHLHLLGRSIDAKSPSWRWGEAPQFPHFADRHIWAKDHRRLNAQECVAIVEHVDARLRDVYDVRPTQINAWRVCESCGYPAADGSCSPCAESRTCPA